MGRASRLCHICDRPVNGHTSVETKDCFVTAMTRPYDPTVDLSEGQDGRDDWCPNCVIPESEHSDFERISCVIDVYGVGAVSEDEKRLWERTRRNVVGTRALGLSI